MNQPTQPTAQWPDQRQWIGAQWVQQPRTQPVFQPQSMGAQQGWTQDQSGQAAIQGQPQSTGVPSQSPTGPQQVTSQWPVQNQPRGQAQIPPVDVLETPDKLLVLVDMAGFDEDDIQLDIDNDVLRIAASRTLEIDDDETLLAQERATRYERYLQLPVEANIEEARAKQVEGVCRITLPKSESARDRHHRIGFQ